MKNKFFIIAGEKSGDNLGGKLIAEILSQNPNAEIKFIGASQMEAAAKASSLFDMTDINLMGFSEILPHIFKLLKRIKQTVSEIINFQPDILITIDSPGFNLRVVKKLRAAKFKTKYVHYVAPSVWAYKPERAKRTAELYDALISIIPWEAPYFEAEGLETKYFGHPIFEDLHFLDDEGRAKVRDKYNITASEKVISIMLGSRKGEIKKHSKIIGAAIKELEQQHKNLRLFILPTKEVAKITESEANDWGLNKKINVIYDVIEKQQILQVSNLAMVKSGTVALEVAALKAPYFIYYKASAFTAWFLRRIINIRYANLVNISADKEIIPELIQEDFNTQKVVEISNKFLAEANYAEIGLNNAAIELEKFKGASNPSKQIAKYLINL